MFRNDNLSFCKLNQLLLPLVLFLASPMVLAVPVNYAVTLDATLNNPNGTWGGNLNVGAGQNLNLTVVFQYESNPSSILVPEATFSLLNLQVLDNTNGLASDVIFGTGGLKITYSGASDRFIGATFGSPGGSLFLPDVMGEFGNAGDDLPFGAALDALVNAAGIRELIARAPDFFNDNVNGVNGAGAIAAGDYVFSSGLAAAPEPGTLGLLGAGLLGLGIGRRRRPA